MSELLDRQRRNTIYNAPKSVAQRVADARKPDAGDAMRARQREEALELGELHRAESVKLSGQLVNERARSSDIARGRGVPEMTFPRENGHGYGLRGRGELFHLVG